MLKRICDRCKLEIKEDEKMNHLYVDEYGKASYKKSIEICDSCMNDFVNMIEYECEIYKIDTVVTISKEAQ